MRSNATLAEPATDHGAPKSETLRVWLDIANRSVECGLVAPSLIAIGLRGEGYEACPEHGCWFHAASEPCPHCFRRAEAGEADAADRVGP